jgi:hypothetical protein
MSDIERYIESLANGREAGLVKFQVPQDGQMPAEWMWAKPLKDDLLKVENIPFFAEIGYGDIVKVGVAYEGVTLNSHDENGNHVPIRNLEEGFLRLERVVERHSLTVRVLYDVEGCDRDGIIARIKEIEEVTGLDTESARAGFVVQCVPIEKATDEFWDGLLDRLDGIDYVTDVFLPVGEENG